jgi:ribosome maturation factor RimP
VTELLGRIEDIVAPTIVGMGYELVRVAMSKGGTLQIMIEPADGRAMDVEACAVLSRALSAVLDVEDPMPGSYTLEVSSPGIDRPLTRLQDFERFAGFEAKLETDRLLDGRRRFRGRILGVAEGELIRVRDGEVEYAVPFDAVAKAKLVLTEDLIAHSPDKPRH